MIKSNTACFMKQIFTLTTLFLFGFAYSQTYVPDDNFEALLETYGWGNGIINDDMVPTSSIDTIQNLILDGSSISDLTGIEDFAALAVLSCANNALSSLDFSNNPNLYYLVCDNNLLTSLDVTNNPALLALYCGDNQLIELDVSNNLSLYELECYENSLNGLDVRNNVMLSLLYCDGNQITELDVSRSTILSDLDCQSNQLTCVNAKNGNNTGIISDNFHVENNASLTCVEVDDPTWSTANWSNIDAGVVFDVNCSNACSSVGISEFNPRPKKLLRIVDLLGRETKLKPNTPLIFLYDDGSAQQVIKDY